MFWICDTYYKLHDTPYTGSWLYIKANRYTAYNAIEVAVATKSITGSFPNICLRMEILG